ncbi:MAG: dihydrodipicolinate reductase [bacterium]|nr:dihydrodipicolinate reductase [bacterium]
MTTTTTPGGGPTRHRIVQWATGNLGRAAIQGIVARPDLELVGVWVHSEDKDGVDAGTLAGIDPIGVAATRDVDRIIALEPDCVIYAPIMADTAQVVKLLEAGIHVVTPLNWFYPAHLDVAELREACERGSAVLHGTGIHPGGMTERLPLLLSAFSQNITYVGSEEFSDCRSYGAPDALSNIMLFGKTKDEVRSSMMPQFMANGFMQSIDMIADALGFALDPDKTTTHDIWVATAPIDTPMGVILPGQVAAQRFDFQGLVRGKTVISAAVNWYMGSEDIEDGFSVGDGGERYEARIDGDPPVRVTLHGVHPDASSTLEEVQKRNPGMVATANHCVSAIAGVCRAAPGIRHYLELPPATGRVRADLGA